MTKKQMAKMRRAWLRNQMAKQTTWQSSESKKRKKNSCASRSKRNALSSNKPRLTDGQSLQKLSECDSIWKPRRKKLVDWLLLKKSGYVWNRRNSNWSRSVSLRSLVKG